MAMGTERSKALHNFTLPCSLRWGNQRHLRCMNVDDSDGSTVDHHHRRATRGRERDQSSSHHVLHGSGSYKLGPTARPSENGDDGIAAIREQVMSDLQTAADKMKDAIFKDGLQQAEPHLRTSVAGATDTPWNLRTRRAACTTTPIKYPVVSNPAAVEKSPKLRNGSDCNGATGSGEKRERVKFSVALSKREIEEDFLGVFGHRPPRRPKKRAKIVQKELDTLFPGLWLTEVTADKYKVPEAIP